MRSAILLAALFLAALTDVAAQGSLSLVPGQRLRVTAPARGAYDLEARYVGTVGGTLILSAGLNVMYPLADVVRLEVLRGQRSYKWPGAVIGLVLGMVIGRSIGKAIDEPCEGWCWDFAQPIGTVVGGLVGVAGGAAIGSRIRSPKWEQVPLDRLRVSVVPQRNRRFGIGISVSF